MLTKLLFYVLLAVLLSVVAAWFASGHGDMVLEWNDYEITASTTTFVFLLIFVVALLVIALPLISQLLNLPGILRRKREFKQSQKGLTAITNTMVAIASGDTNIANKELKAVRKSLKDEAIIPLLETQIAAAEKNQERLESSLGAMAGFSKTQALAAKGLADLHIRKGETIAAIPYAEKAVSLEPKSREPLLMTLSLYIQNNQLDQAEALIAQGKKQRLINKERSKELLASCAYLRSVDAADNAVEARRYIADAYALAPYEAHIIERCIVLHNVKDHVEAAVKTLKRSWEGCFFPGLYDLAQQLHVDSAARAKLYHKLVSLSLTGKPYALILLSRLAWQENDVKNLHRQLGRFHEVQASEYTLEAPDKEPHPAYLSRMEDALEQAASQLKLADWQCRKCGSKAEHWHAVCGECDALIAYEPTT